MQNDTKNAEDLHNVGQGTKSPTKPEFWNGSNANPMVTLNDLTNPEVSKSATDKLRSSLIKDK